MRLKQVGQGKVGRVNAAAFLIRVPRRRILVPARITARGKTISRGKAEAAAPRRPDPALARCIRGSRRHDGLAPRDGRSGRRRPGSHKAT